MQTVKFFTLGCKVNQYETQELRERFIQAGFKEIDNGRKADLCIINTCTVTASADRKSRYLIHSSHRQNPKAKIIVTGCYTQLDSEEIASIPGVTWVIKNKDKENIPRLLKIPHQTKLPDRIGITHFAGHTRAFLKIQDGCQNLCSYCKVPLVRGVLKSKPLNEIIQEAEGLIKNGFKEIVLCGICLGAYGRDLPERMSLEDVIGALEKIQGLWRLRLSSIEASDISKGLLKKLAESQKLCRHLHIPLQSGDDEILRNMNRKFNRQDYIDLINKIKSRIPKIAITTDVMVGFPGEDEFHFQNTLNLIKEILPLKVHIFPYSPRRGTVAYNFKDKVDALKIKERIVHLESLSEACALTYKKQFLNKNMDVLIEQRCRENKAYWEGYTDNYIKVRVKSDRDLRNQLVSLRLKKTIKDYILADC